MFCNWQKLLISLLSLLSKFLLSSFILRLIKQNKVTIEIQVTLIAFLYLSYLTAARSKIPFYKN